MNEAKHGESMSDISSPNVVRMGIGSPRSEPRHIPGSNSLPLIAQSSNNRNLVASPKTTPRTNLEKRAAAGAGALVHKILGSNGNLSAAVVEIIAGLTASIAGAVIGMAKLYLPGGVIGTLGIMQLVAFVFEKMQNSQADTSPKIKDE